jgi:hypothetical protein
MPQSIHLVDQHIPQLDEEMRDALGGGMGGEAEEEKV